jgi:hypothetical protein
MAPCPSDSIQARILVFLSIQINHEASFSSIHGDLMDRQGIRKTLTKKTLSFELRDMVNSGAIQTRFSKSIGISYCLPD